MTHSVKQRFSTFPGGAGIGTQVDVVDVFLHDGDTSAEANIDTNADSIWTWTWVPTGSAGAGWLLNPGPVYWEGTYTGRIRVGSSFSGGVVGANSLLELPNLWKAWGNGVFEDAVAGNFAVTYDAAGLDVDIAAGLYNLDGIFVANPSSRELTVSAADGSNPRIDRVILELVRTAGDTEGKVTLKMKNGTPAASPVAPTLTDDANTLQVSLAQIRVNAGSTAVTSVTDERAFTLSEIEKNPSIDTTARTAPGATALTTTGTSISALAQSPTLVSGVWYLVFVEADLAVDGASDVAQIACFIDGAGNASDYQSAPAQAALVSLGNSHSRHIQGAGAAVSCGVLSKKSGAASVNYYSGTCHVLAIPES